MCRCDDMTITGCAKAAGVWAGFCKRATTSTFVIHQKWDGMCQVLCVQQEIELTGAERAQLAKHQVFRDTTHMVSLRIRCCIHQDFDGFLKRAAHEAARLGSVDSVSRDCH